MSEWQGAGLENRYARKGFGVRLPVPPPPCARSSGDRASHCGCEGRRFKSSRAYQLSIPRVIQISIGQYRSSSPAQNTKNKDLTPFITRAKHQK